MYIAENVVSDLLSSLENVKNETLDLEAVKPKLVTRFGKILFHEKVMLIFYSELLFLVNSFFFFLGHPMKI